QTTVYLDRVRENSSNCRCADCNAENPTIAIMSWLLIICKKCAAIHHRLTSNTSIYSDDDSVVPSKETN
ncbi:unnamed protein product, partial [Rotaria sordida]